MRWGGGCWGQWGTHVLSLHKNGLSRVQRRRHGLNVGGGGGNGGLLGRQRRLPLGRRLVSPRAVGFEGLQGRQTGVNHKGPCDVRPLWG